MLSDLGSVLNGIQSHDTPVQPFHTSFRDFLLDPERSKDWCIDIKTGHTHMASGCFRLMNEQLRFNICGLPSSFQSNDRLLETGGRRDAISSTLEYACQFWDFHLERSQDGSIKQDHIAMFIKEKLLFWLEVLSLLGLLNSAPPALQT